MVPLFGGGHLEFRAYKKIGVKAAGQGAGVGHVSGEEESGRRLLWTRTMRTPQIDEALFPSLRWVMPPKSYRGGLIFADQLVRLSADYLEPLGRENAVLIRGVDRYLKTQMLYFPQINAAVSAAPPREPLGVYLSGQNLYMYSKGMVVERDFSKKKDKAFRRYGPDQNLEKSTPGEVAKASQEQRSQEQRSQEQRRDRERVDHFWSLEGKGKKEEDSASWDLLQRFAQSGEEEGGVIASMQEGVEAEGQRREGGCLRSFSQEIYYDVYLEAVDWQREPYPESQELILLLNFYSLSSLSKNKYQKYFVSSHDVHKTDDGAAVPRVAGKYSFESSRIRSSRGFSDQAPQLSCEAPGLYPLTEDISTIKPLKSARVTLPDELRGLKIFGYQLERYPGTLANVARHQDISVRESSYDALSGALSKSLSKAIFNALPNAGAHTNTAFEARYYVLWLQTSPPHGYARRVRPEEYVLIFDREFSLDGILAVEVEYYSPRMNVAFLPPIDELFADQYHRFYD